MRNLFFLLAFIVLGGSNIYAQGHDGGGSDAQENRARIKKELAKKMKKAQIKAYNHFNDFDKTKLKGKVLQIKEGWHKGNFEIWFRTDKGEIGKVHYSGNGYYRSLEWRDWLKYG
jgi:hypothetical protein